MKPLKSFKPIFPQATLLIDTYDTVAAAKRLQAQVDAGVITVKGVRIDSGDLGELSQKVRCYLPDTHIFASGDLDEWKIAELQQQGASIDGYGIGTKLVTGEPVNGVYKLVEIDHTPTMKQSSNKLTYPGCKQIFRTIVNGQVQSDRLGLKTEFPEANEECLLEMVMQSGKRLQSPESLEIIRQRTAHSVASLPDTIRQISKPQIFNVNISSALEDLRQSVVRKTIDD
jgi:nicotinate phosphoribosyltransferase